MQDALTQALIERRARAAKGGHAREHTWDRVLLAERLRRRLTRSGRWQASVNGQVMSAGALELPGLAGAHSGEINDPAGGAAETAGAAVAGLARRIGGAPPSPASEFARWACSPDAAPTLAEAAKLAPQLSLRLSLDTPVAKPPAATPAAAVTSAAAAGTAADVSADNAPTANAPAAGRTRKRPTMRRGSWVLGSDDVTATESLRIECDGKGPTVVRSLKIGAHLAEAAIDGGKPASRQTSRRERRRRSHASALAALGRAPPSIAAPSTSAAPPAAAAAASSAPAVAALAPAAPAEGTSPLAAARAVGGTARAAAAIGDAALSSDGVAPSARLRVVAISDTHGFEAQLLGEASLPEGDVLVHCGDWSHHGTPERVRAAQAELDTWLAAQPHKHKLIVRGNHDSVDATFPLSRAVYATTPMRIELDGVTFSLVPYFHPGRLGRHVPAGARARTRLLPR